MKWTLIIIYFILLEIMAEVRGKELKKTSKNMDRIANLIVIEGYDYEIHTVVTEDDYVLKLHRLVTKKEDSIKRQAIFLMHGLFATASDYLILGRNLSLAYLLFDGGYDVWMGNNRGTDYSLKHNQFDSNSSEFWNFSFHEIGIYDLPAMIDYVLETTKESSLFYVGHSQGGTDLLVLLSTLPKYNQKIKQAHLMAPASFMNHPHPLVETIASTYELILKALDMEHKIPLVEPLKHFSLRFCDNALSSLCTNAIFFLAGRNTNEELQIDVSKYPDIIDHFAEAISTKQVGHFLQLYISKRFCQYDYKHFNKRYYNANEPPDYELNKIKTSLFIYAAMQDRIVSKMDIDILYNKIVEVVKLYQVIPVWNHADFVYGKTARKLLYESILQAFDEYNQNQNLGE